MEMEPNRVITVSTSIEHGEPGTLKREASRVDRLVERVEELASRVDSLAKVVQLPVGRRCRRESPWTTRASW